MTVPRRLEPGRVHAYSRRTARRTLFLLPTPPVNMIVGYTAGYALERTPTVRVPLATWMALARAHAAVARTAVQVVADDGTVLADSERDPAGMENHSHRPEIRDAAASGLGRPVRRAS